MRNELVRISFAGLIVLGGWALVSACSDRDHRAKDALAQTQASHIEANIPAQEDFARLLQRDLRAYFDPDSDDEHSVDYEFLREGPTQSGASYPKFYLWVRVHAEDSIEREGAARVAAIDRTRFEVMDFVSRDEIAADPSIIRQVFPGTVCDRIEQKVREPEQ